jgi:RHS repeat-associated protein
MVDPNGNGTVYGYRDLELQSVTHAAGTSFAATTTYTYDPSTLGIASETDPNGHTTTYAYDGQGNELSKVDPLGRTTTSTYSSLDEPLTVTDPLGVTTTSLYDGNGNLLSVSTPLTGTSESQTMTYAYGDASHPGDVTATTDPDGNVTTYTYDAAGDQTSSTDPDGHTTSTSFNSLGQKISTTDPLGHMTSYTYDALGDTLTVTDPMGHVTTNTYDADQNLLSTTDPNGNTTSYTYDADNELTKTTNPGGSSTEKSYDGDGNVLTTTNAGGDVTVNTYDALNRLSSTKDPLGHLMSYQYDPDGNLKLVTDASGRTTTNAYDADNELVSVAYSGRSTPGVTHTYDADGRRVSMTDGTGTTVYQYDSLGRLTYTKNESSALSIYGYDLSYGYDMAGNVTSITYPNGQVATQGYDPAGNLVSVSDWLGHTSTFTYDGDNNLLSEATGSRPTVTDSYTYDADNALTSTTDASGSKVLQSFVYTRTPVGNVASAVENAGKTIAYAYDSQNQLSSDSQGSYSYDPAGNVTALTSISPMKYNADSELTLSGSGQRRATYTYDAEGNRTSVSTHNGLFRSVYTFNQLGELTSVVGTTAAYTYNGDGLLASRTNGSVSSPFIWNTVAGTPLLLSDGSSSYLYGPNGLPVEQITYSSASFFHRDQLGSTTMLTNATGKIVGSYTYDSYGSLRSGNAYATPLLYAGQYFDSESGFYYLRARDYDPITGQFISADPADSLTEAPYFYAGNDPIDNTDPLGLWNPITAVLQVTHHAAHDVYNWGSDAYNAAQDARSGFDSFTSNHPLIGTIVGFLPTSLIPATYDAIAGAASYTAHGCWSTSNSGSSLCTNLDSQEIAAARNLLEGAGSALIGHAGEVGAVLSKVTDLLYYLGFSPAIANSLGC